MSRSRYLPLVVPLVAVLGCGRERSEPRSGSATPAGGSATAVAPAPDPCAKAKPHGPLAWIEDDYAAALACARATGRPLVLDLWAPWCHTCLSMQTTVFTDPSFAADKDRFVFVALDTDREGNADAVDRYPLSAWPTFYVVAPDERVLGRFVGAASVAQFHALLDTGARALAGGAAGADAELLAAERHIQGDELEDADRALVAALAAAPPDWARRADALVSLIGVRHKRNDFAACLELAERSLDDTGDTASATDFSYHALACATARATEEPARVKALRAKVAARLTKLVDDPAAPLSVDDRSDALANLREVLDQLGRSKDAKVAAERQRALLDDAAAKAGSPRAAMTYNWPRAEVYVYLGRPLELVPALEQSARALPEEYDPAARLGWVLAKAGKLDEAATWTDKALALVYGPRKVRLLTQRAEIAAARGELAAVRRYRKEIVKTLEALPPSQTSAEAIAKAKALAELDVSVETGSGSAAAAH